MILKLEIEHSVSAALDEDGGKQYFWLAPQVIVAKENHPVQAVSALFPRKIRGISILGLQAELKKVSKTYFFSKPDNTQGCCQFFNIAYWAAPEMMC